MIFVQTGNSEEHFRVLSLKSGEEIKGYCSFQDSFYIGSKIKRGTDSTVTEINPSKAPALITVMRWLLRSLYLATSGE